MKSIGPERWRHGGVEQHSANTVIESVQDTFSSTVLLGGVRTCETKDYATRGEEGAKSSIVEFTAIVRLECCDRLAELCLHIRMKGDEGRKDIRFSA